MYKYYTLIWTQVSFVYNKNNLIFLEEISSNELRTVISDNLSFLLGTN